MTTQNLNVNIGYRDNYYVNTFGRVGKIAAGTKGEVYKVFNKTLDNNVVYTAIKTLETDAGLQHSVYESLILQLLHTDPSAGQYVVQHIDSWFENKEKKDLFYIQMEYCLIDLTTFLSRRYEIFRAGQDWQPMPELEFFVCCQLYLRLVNCLKYIHSNVVPVIHSDLHFSNVLLAKFEDKLAVKLADFDLSITINRENNNKDKYCHYDIMNLSYRLTELFDFKNHNPQNYEIVGNGRKADIKAISDDLIDQDRLRNNDFLSYNELVDDMNRWQISPQSLTINEAIIESFNVRECPVRQLIYTLLREYCQ